MTCLFNLAIWLVLLGKFLAQGKDAEITGCFIAAVLTLVFTCFDWMIFKND